MPRPAVNCGTKRSSTPPVRILIGNIRREGNPTGADLSRHDRRAELGWNRSRYQAELHFCEFERRASDRLDPEESEIPAGNGSGQRISLHPGEWTGIQCTGKGRQWTHHRKLALQQATMGAPGCHQREHRETLRGRCLSASMRRCRPANRTSGSQGFGGPMVTAGGLLFIGATTDNRFRAFESKTGKELWAAKLDYNVQAIPMTYQGKNGKQYVAVIAAAGGPRGANNESLVVFALP